MRITLIQIAALPGAAEPRWLNLALACWASAELLLQRTGSDDVPGYSPSPFGTYLVQVRGEKDSFSVLLATTAIEQHGFRVVESTTIEGGNLVIFYLQPGPRLRTAIEFDLKTHPIAELTH